MNCNKQSKTIKIIDMLKIFKKNSNIFASVINQQDIAIAKIMYLIKINKWCYSDFLKTLLVSDLQKSSLATLSSF